jgi:solute carrier family 20 (sodium-dependent phosphate transporter)
MKQAIIIASFTEFGGAMLLGSGVTDTIKSGIADITTYTDKPELLMFGMVCALLACGLWLLLATYLELPVSTTHSIVGAIIGMTMVTNGAGSVIWTSPGDPFPGGVVAIVLAWFVTPAMAAVMAALLFMFTKLFVLKAKNPFK